MLWLLCYVACTSAAETLVHSGRRLATSMQSGYSGNTSPTFTTNPQTVYPKLILTTTDGNIESVTVQLVHGADVGDIFAIDSECTAEICAGAQYKEKYIGTKYAPELLLSGPSTATEFQAALRHVTFKCTSNTPTATKYVSVKATRMQQGKQLLQCFNSAYFCVSFFILQRSQASRQN